MLKELFTNQYLVALDAQTGKKLWERGVNLNRWGTVSEETLSPTLVMWLNYVDGIVVVLGTSDKYYLHAFDAKKGTLLWNQEHGWSWADHGCHTRHPLIVGNIVYVEPYAYDLKTGEKLPFKMPHRGGHCGTTSASSAYLFYRDNPVGAVVMWDRKGERRYRWDGVRPGCWINIIPAGGIVMVPEASSGCICCYPIQTSYALIPIGEGRALLRTN